MLEKMLMKKRLRTPEESWAYQQKDQACPNKISVAIMRSETILKMDTRCIQNHIGKGGKMENLPNRLGQHFGNYQLIRMLGRGGAAEVYLGKHLYLKTHAAIKLLRG